MALIEKELWETFTYYGLHAQPMDPLNMSYKTLLNICHECGLFKRNNFAIDLTHAEVNSIFASEARRNHDKKKAGGRYTGGSGQLPMVPYGVFLDCLLRIAQRLFPPAPSASVKDVHATYAGPWFTAEKAMQKLLMEHIFLYAKKRGKTFIDDILEQPEIQRLKQSYHHSLKQFFDYYVGQGLNSQLWMLSDLERARDSTLKQQRKAILHWSNPRPRGPLIDKVEEAAQEHLHRTLGHASYLQIAKDIGCGGRITISTIELGDAYLSTVTPKNAKEALGVLRLNYEQFWECLVRWAILARRADYPDASPDEKLKGLFLDMFHHLQATVPQITDSFFTPKPPVPGHQNRGTFISGIMAFNERFLLQWNKDQFRFYPAPNNPPLLDGSVALGQAATRIEQEANMLPKLAENRSRKTAKRNIKKSQVGAARAHDTIAVVEGQPEEALGDSRITLERLNKLLSRKEEYAQLILNEVSGAPMAS